MVKVEIDEGSGFCFGVVTAIHKAEEELAKGVTLYCLGDIVHNSREVERLKEMGLITINHEEFKQLHNAKVLLRAHGEPPETYIIAKENNIEIIDATCPAVLWIQLTDSSFRLQDSHLLRLAFPHYSARNYQYRMLSEPQRYFYLWFGLFRVRSPLLAESRLISLPRPT